MDVEIASLEAGHIVSREPRRLLVVAMVLAAVLLAVAGGLLAWLDRATPSASAGDAPGQIVNGLALVAVAAAVLSRSSERRMGVLLAVLGFSHLLACAGQGYVDYGELTDPGALPAAEWAVFPATGWAFDGAFAATLLPLLFPTGRLPSSRWRPVLWLVGAGLLLFIGGLLIDPQSPTRGEYIPTAIAGGQVAGTAISAVGLVLIGAAAVLSIASLVQRLRRAEGVEREQLRWLAYGAALIVATEIAQAFLPSGVDDILEPLSYLVLPAAVAVAILRYRLYDIDVVIARSVVYGGLTAVVVGGYAAIVTLLELVLHGRASFGVSVVASGAVALAFGPVRAWLQTGAQHLVYGRRAEPYRVLADLGRQLEAAVSPDAVLPAIVANLTSLLRLPHAAILLHGDDGPVPAAVSGTPVGRPIDLPLIHHGREVGRLIASPRATGTTFTVAERDLLADVARQAGAAAHAVQLTGGLQRSRMRLVTAREEERRRIRRDLHDGLGPTLAGVTLRLDAARRQAREDPDAAQAEMLALRQDIQEAIGGIRELVYDLRPPALDELGLIAAIAERGQRIGGHLRTEVRATTSLEMLPAAVEVAALRIAQEAMTNAARHARARHCTVTIGRAEPTCLTIEIVDDGQGLPAQPRAGVGLRSMRERVEELGGRLELDSVPGAGTTVRALLPVPS